MAKDKQEIKEVSKIVYNDTLYEQVYDPKTKQSYYIGWDKQKQEPVFADEIIHDPIKYIPIRDELLEKGAVTLPNEATEYNSIQDLELEIDAFIQTWLDISEEHRQKAVWYILLTWLIDKIDTIPYLRALGDYGTGKTRYLDVIGGLCYKPMFVGGAPTPAPIFRTIDLWRGTTIFDEFTLDKSDETQDIIKILNCGYQRGKPVIRCDKNNPEKVNAFDPFGAKIIASRKTFYDQALESRCITEIMKQTNRNDLPIGFTKEFKETKKELQNKLLMYRFKNINEINPDESITIDFGNIQPRIKQSFIPFTILFQHNNKRLTEFIQYVKNYNKQTVEENSTTFDGQIINHYIQLLDEHDQEQQTLENDDYQTPHITASTIKDSMTNNGWKEEDLKIRTIGRHLKALGFTSTPTKIAGKTQRIITINEENLERIRSRYTVT